ncbi:MAG TPA: M48 family metalloprotease [Thermoanaerobaculia bacterium]|nr:M48 family metalloprotease [Thermoanaerobaculia bacterium]
MIPTGSRPARRGFGGGRLIIAAIVAIVSIITYYSQRSSNPVTGEVQHVDLSPQQEVALGLQAAPEMAQQHGGLHPDAEAQAVVDRVGRRIVERSAARESPYQYEFHVLADEDMINAFALPGGQVFITAGLLKRMQTEGQLAGVLGHEIGHVVARHGAEHLAKARLTQGLTGAAVLATYDPENPASRNSAAVAALIGNLVNMRFGRNDELESDKLGVRFTAEADYDPRAMLEVMRVLAESASGPRPPEFFSTHPNPERRVERIQAAIAEVFPNGVPEELED